MYNEAVDGFVEITLKSPQDFLKIKETLSRIGVSSRNEKILYQSCHILHKRGRYYIVHFKELFKLDGKDSSINESDYARRNTIVALLEEWGLLSVVDDERIKEPRLHIKKLKILNFREKDEWKLVQKYSIGK